MYGFPIRPKPSTNRRSRQVKDVFFDIAIQASAVGFCLVLSHLLTQQVFSLIEWWGSRRTIAAKCDKKLQKISLNEYERVIAEHIVEPAAITTTFDSIGGLENCKSEIMDLVILPLKRPDLFASRSSLVASPKGVLFYGAPGTGKTMLARAIAKESGAVFLNLTMSTLMNKYFGESNKHVAAVFSLARKLAPSIVFIDEIDCFLFSRGGANDNDSLTNMKAEFMSHWDGLLSEEGHDRRPVMVLGATNRPFDLDQAILRRLPRSFEIGLPDEKARCHILKLLLKGEHVEAEKEDEEREYAGKVEAASRAPPPGASASPLPSSPSSSSAAAAATTRSPSDAVRQPTHNPAEASTGTTTTTSTGTSTTTSTGTTSTGTSTTTSTGTSTTTSTTSSSSSGSSSGPAAASPVAGSLKTSLQEEKGAVVLEALCGWAAARTEGYSGSDLKELCRAALMGPIREASQAYRDLDEQQPTQEQMDGREGGEGSRPRVQVRALRRSDLAAALGKVKATGVDAAAFEWKELKAQQRKQLQLKAALLAAVQQEKDLGI